MRRSVLAAIVGVLVATGLQAAPASAALRTPDKVGLVSFVKADYDRKSNRTSLSLDWPDARHAKKYEIFVSRYSSMKKAKRYEQKSSKTTIKKLVRGKDYFVQVRGINRSKKGKKSNTVGHTTILRPGPSNNLMPLRIMSYNVCSDVCDVIRSTSDSWLPTRQSGVLERMAASGAGVIATQEAGEMNVVPVGYKQSIHVSAKRIFYNEARFDLAPATTPPPVEPARDAKNCRPTYQWGQPVGHIFLGYHGGGCRYAVWTELVERSTGRSFMMVNVHTVSGSGKTNTNNRRTEINEMLANIKRTNTKGLPVIYAGDFNSHKQTRTSDSVRPPMHATKHYDAFDLARVLSGQHMNSYNGFRTTPVIGTKWGDHIDKIWVDPWKVRVDGWYNFAQLGADGKLVTPIPSDHSPIVVDVRIG